MPKKPTDHGPLQVVSLTIENVKRIKAVRIVPEDDALIQLTGKNGAGKSTVLDSIWWALKGKAVVDPEPIRTGEERATIVLDLGALIVTRVFRRGEDGEVTTSLKVESAEGALFPSPQKLLDDLLGSLTFDPLAFLEKDAKGQVADLAKLLKLEVDLDLLNGQNAADYENRKDVNRRVKELAGKVSTLRVQALEAINAATHGSGKIDADLSPIDTGELVRQMADASRVNSARDNEKRNRDQIAVGIEDMREKARQRRERAAQLIAEAEQLEQTADSEAASLAAREPIGELVDTADLLERIQKADAQNQKLKAAKDARDNLARAVAEYEAEETKADTLTQRMAAREQQKSDAIAAAQMPIDGLGFGNGIVTYNDHPLSQASTGEQWSVSLAIAGAMNPKLRVVMIRQGALMDSDRIRQTAEWAAANGYQVWMERVEESGRIGIVMEDGEARVAEAEA